jgi:membrane-bound ClpP family serine protease
MADGIGIIVLIVLGLLLVIVELFLIPGATVVGILGFLFAAAGVLMSYSEFGAAGGSMVLAFTLISMGALLYLGFKGNVWSKFALKDKIKSRVNEEDDQHFQIGEEGYSVSALRPMGKGEFRGKNVEVRSNGNFIDASKPIRIIRNKDNVIVVEEIIK